MFRRCTWIGAALCFLALGCQSSEEGEGDRRAIARFTDLVEKRIVVDKDEAAEILAQCFVAGTRASRYEALFKTATWNTKEMVDGKQIEVYEWHVAIGTDGTALVVCIDVATGRVTGTYTSGLWS